MFPLHSIRYPTSQGQSALTDRIHMPQPVAFLLPVAALHPGAVLLPPGGRHTSAPWWAPHLSCPGGRHISVVLVGHGGSMNSMAVEGCEGSKLGVGISVHVRLSSTCFPGCHPQTLLLPPRVSRPPTVIARWLPGPPSSHSCIKSFVGRGGKEKY